MTTQEILSAADKVAKLTLQLHDADTSRLRGLRDLVIELRHKLNDLRHDATEHGHPVIANEAKRMRDALDEAIR
jgi:hypothetical protein